MIKFLYDTMGKVIAKSHSLYMHELDVTRFLSVVNSVVSIRHCDMRVGNCGWADSPSAWFLYFKATDKEWKKIVRRLNVIRVWSVIEIPTCIMNAVYSTD